MFQLCSCLISVESHISGRLFSSETSARASDLYDSPEIE